MICLPPDANKKSLALYRLLRQWAKEGYALSLILQGYNLKKVARLLCMTQEELMILLSEERTKSLILRYAKLYFASTICFTVVSPEEVKQLE